MHPCVCVGGIQSLRHRAASLQGLLGLLPELSFAAACTLGGGACNEEVVHVFWNKCILIGLGYQIKSINIY